MPRIGALEYVKYGDFTFPATHVRIKVEPVMTATHRRTKYLRVVLTLNTILSFEDLEDSNNAAALGVSTPFASDSFQDAIPILLRYISRTGRTLQYPNSILGSFTVQRTGTQTSTTHIDVEGGPKPNVVLLEPLGPNKACRLVWEVTCCIPECTNQDLLRYDSFQELSYSIIWDIGNGGLTTRTVTGFYEVPLLSALSGVDDARAKLEIKPLPGFHRSQNWRVTEDRRQMHFTLVDTEIDSPNPYYPGIADMEVTQEMTNLNIAYNRWELTLTGDLTLHVGANRYQALRAFSLVLVNRIGPLLNFINTNGQGQFIKLSKLVYREGIYSRRFGFTFIAEIQLAFPFLLAATSFGNAIKGVTWNDWDQYRNRLLARGRGDVNYGPAGLGLGVSETGVQLDCNPAPNVLSSNPVLDNQQEFFDAIFSSCPPKEKSIQDFDVDVVLNVGKDQLDLLPIEAQPDVVRDDTPSRWDAGKTFVQPPYTTGTLNIIPGLSLPSVSVRGTIRRLNFKPELPLPVVNGKQVKIHNLYMSTPKIVDTTLTGCPVYEMTFSYNFYLDPKVPSQDVIFRNAPDWWNNPFQPSSSTNLPRP